MKGERDALHSLPYYSTRKVPTAFDEVIEFNRLKTQGIHEMAHSRAWEYDYPDPDSFDKWKGLRKAHQRGLWLFLGWLSIIDKRYPRPNH